eukprot:364224-Chlamydomonas_euryale.AAC.11
MGVPQSHANMYRKKGLAWPKNADIPGLDKVAAHPARRHRPPQLVSRCSARNAAGKFRQPNDSNPDSEKN